MVVSLAKEVFLQFRKSVFNTGMHFFLRVQSESQFPLASKIILHIPYTFTHSRIAQVDTRHSIKTAFRKAPSTSCAISRLSSLQPGKKKHTEQESGEQRKQISFFMYQRELKKMKSPGNSSEKGGQLFLLFTFSHLGK